MKKFVKKTLSIALALVMCAGMVAPAFAASFTDLQDAINGVKAPDPGESESPNPYANGTKFKKENDETEYYGYGWSQKEGEETGHWGIEAWDVTDKDGQTNRNVQLNEDVKYSENEGPEKNTRIEINADGSYWKNQSNKNVTIDLKGHDIDATGSTASEVILVNSTDYTYANQPKFDANLTLKDSSVKTAEDASGKITGGKTGISVGGVGQLTIENGAISENSGTGVVLKGKGQLIMNDGSIDNNGGCGVQIATGGTVLAKITMTGGTISNNKGDHGVFLTSSNADHVAFEMSGGSITGHHADGTATGMHGGGVYINSGTFQMDGGSIEKNTAVSNGGGVILGTATAHFVMNGGTIANNEAGGNGGGVSGAFQMKGGTITGNKAGKGGGGISVSGGNTKLNGTVRDNEAPVGENMVVTVGQSNNAGTATVEVDGYTYTVAYSKPNNDLNQQRRERTFTIEVRDSDGNLINSQAEIVVVTVGRGLVPQLAIDTESLNFTVPEGSKVQNYPNQGDSDYVTERGGYLDKEGVFHEAPAPVVPSDPSTGDNATIDDTDVPTDEAPDETEIADPAVPLAAGPVTRAEFIDYLWRHEGEPASDGVCTFTDVPEDHEYVLALAWAEQNKVAFAYDDGTFEPDELVTVAAVREFLGNFETVFGRQAVAASALTTLTGADDEAVLNCDEVLAEFFGA